MLMMLIVMLQQLACDALQTRFLVQSYNMLK